MDKKSRVEYALEQMELDMEYLRNQIIFKSRHLANDLNKVANSLEVGKDGFFNRLGAIQGNGVELDRIMGEFSVLREAHALISNAVEHDKAPKDNAR